MPTPGPNCCGPFHGYGIGQHIMQMSQYLLRVKEGSL